MNNYDISEISGIAVHKIGNKLNNEGILLAKECLRVDEDIQELLISYFLSPFKSDEYYTLYHDSDVSLNEVYAYASALFENPDRLLEESVLMAKHLYENSSHPKIKGGELYTVYFRDCVIDGETVDAIGLFKSENKDTFLKVYPRGDAFEIESETGININKLDKGCLIFNTEKENGYVVTVVDNTNKSSEAQYWMDHFLHIRQRRDDFYQTQNVLNLCKDFVVNELPEKFSISKADQADLLNKSVKFFKEKDSFDMEEFTEEVMAQSDVVEEFKSFRNQYQEESETQIADNFEISNTAVKKEARGFKSVIKLDKNFHIYIHGDRDLVEQGREANGKKYYKLFYDEEH